MRRIRQISEASLALGLAGMVIMVFANVVLRYAFASGITFSEEVSRFLFVWITFLGAVLAFVQGGHIAMETLIHRLPAAAQRFCALASMVLTVGCCVLMVMGGWQQTLINLDNFAPVSGLPRGAIYFAAVFAGICIGLSTLWNIWRVLRGAPVNDFRQQAVTE